MPGLQAVLLGAAIHNRVNAGALLHIEGTDALGRMDLVSAHGHQVDGQLFHLQGQLAIGLYRVAVDGGIGRDAPYLLSDLLIGQHGAHLIVHQHEAHQNGIRGHLGEEVLRQR